jgi:gamma-glutamyl phosphate reductase
MQDARLVLKPHVLVERDGEDEDVVLIDSHTGRMSACNETASVLVLKLQGGSTVSGLVEALTTQFKVEGDVASRDVHAVLDALSYAEMLDTSE